MNKFKYLDILGLSTQLFIKAGLDKYRSEVTAKTLIESDLMGHFTHGLALLNPYLSSIENGGMKMSGEPITINDTGSTLTWDGQYLPGCWLTHKAIDIAFERIKDHPVVTVAISKSHHIGCLAAYPERATSKDLMLVLTCSDPRNNTVAPFGGLTGMFSPNPLAFGVPTEGQPIIVDISMSKTANGMINMSHAKGDKLPHPWLLDNNGNLTDDPGTFFQEPPSTIVPIGGLDTGYKGFGLGLFVELLTSGLAGYGRMDDPEGWGASVYLQVIDPEAFGGRDKLKKQAQHMVDSFKKSKPIDPKKPVRIPGERALKLKADRIENGLVLSDDIMASLKKWSEKLNVESEALGYEYSF